MMNINKNKEVIEGPGLVNENMGFIVGFGILSGSNKSIRTHFTISLTLCFDSIVAAIKFPSAKSFRRREWRRDGELRGIKAAAMISGWISVNVCPVAESQRTALFSGKTISSVCTTPKRSFVYSIYAFNYFFFYFICIRI